LEWRHSGSPRSQKFQVQKFTEKFLSSIFWDQYGIYHIDYLPKDLTINTEYYSFLLVQMKDILKERRHGKSTKRGLFLHNNTLAHRTLATQKKLAYLCFQCLDHPPYSPDLVLLEYHLFPWTEETIEWPKFSFLHGGHCCCGDLGRRAIL
jgi:hypothetical protein